MKKKVIFQFRLRFKRLIKSSPGVGFYFSFSFCDNRKRKKRKRKIQIAIESEARTQKLSPIIHRHFVVDRKRLFEIRGKWSREQEKEKLKIGWRA
jgi:hypothetical protein